ncbi:MAG: alpha/beta hydrolase [Dehalococcoidia bacterium]
MPVVSVHGLYISYHRYAATEPANAAALPLIIARGLAAPASDWDRFAAVARARGPVVVYDPRGAGGSDPGPDPAQTTIADLSADLVGLLDALGVGRAHLLGHSLGGVIALDLLLRRPERVGAAVLLSATPEPVPPEQRARALALLARGDVAMLPPPAGGEAPRAPAPRAPDPRGWERQAALAHALVNRPDQTPYLEGVTVPALILVGERESEAMQRGAELLHGWIPTSRLVRIEGAGHHAHLEQPDAFERLALDFLDEMDAAVSGHEGGAT